MIRTKIFCDKFTNAAEQLEKFFDKECISREQVISVSLSVSDTGANRILLVYEDKK
jgi:hypothetical protein